LFAAWNLGKINTQARAGRNGRVDFYSFASAANEGSAGFSNLSECSIQNGSDGNEIMKLSRTVAYAVQATLQLAKNETSQPVPCSTLASEGKMPERFLLQILRNLVTHGILRSTRGVDGGYSLVKPPNDISLLEVIEAIEGPYDSAPLANEGGAESSQEKLKDALFQVASTTRNQLEAIKLSQLLPPPPE
jgi:Rrf2 family transcriptional regulator, cysteine metabolism repressor